MSNPDFRALCAKLVDALAEWQLGGGPPEDTADDDLINRARAALAQTNPVAPTDEALANFSGWFCRNYPGPDTIIHKPEWHAPKVFRAAAYALARWGRPAIGTVPVSERITSGSLTSSPAGSLVERVGNRMPLLPDGRVDDASARAAILEVAAAALQMHSDKNLTWERVALWLEQEANR